MLRHGMIRRFRWLPLAVMLLTSPLVAVGVIRLETDSSGFVQWLPDDQQDKQEYLQFVELFGGDDYVLVTWQGATIDDTRIDRVAEALLEADAAREAADSERLIDRVNSGRAILRELMDEPLNLTRTQAVERLRGILVGPDRQTTGVIVQATPAGKIRQQEVMSLIRRVTHEAGGIPSKDLRLGGTIYEAVTIEQSTERSLRDFALPILFVTLALTWWCFRSIPLTVMVLGCAAYCRCVSLALVYFSGSTLSPVLVVMPVLVYVLTISGAVHLVNYYRDAVAEGFGADAPLQALRAGWLPCCLAGATTSIGLMSLAVSGIGPVRDFGVYSSISLLLSVGLLLAFLPSVLTFLRVRSPGPDPADTDDTAGEDTRALPGPEEAGRWYVRHLRPVLQYHQWIVTGGLLLVIGLGTGLLRTETTVELDRLFEPDSEILQNYRWIESNFGPLVPVEALITFPADHPTDLPARLELIDAAEQLLRQTEPIAGTMSAATFVPPVPRATGFQSGVSRRIFGIRAEKQRDRIEDGRFLATAETREIWRISARVPTFVEVDYASFRRSLQEQIRELLTRRVSTRPDEIQVQITGLLPLIDTAQRQLLDDLVESFVLAVILICPVMMFVLRGVLAGLISMLPNVVPVLAIFGGLGWLGMRVDVGAVLTASVALGIAVDDTLHMLTWYARGIRRGLDRPAAVQNACARCAPAMTQTTLICGLGLFVLSTSSFVPTAQFAWLILVLLLAALVGDLVLLPALLVGRAGRLMIRGLIPLDRTE